MTAAAVQEAHIRVREGDTLATAVRNGRLGSFAATSPYAACLVTLLTECSWRGAPRRFLESLPHFVADLDLVAVRNVLAALGLTTRPVHTRLAGLDARLMPCLFVPDIGAPMVALGRTDQGLRVFEAASGTERVLVSRDVAGTAYPVTEKTSEDPAFAVDGSTEGLVHRFRRLLGVLFGLGFALNLLALAVPIAVMVVYDKVIATAAGGLLHDLVLAIAVVLAIDVLLRVSRARLAAAIGARIERLLNVAVFTRLLLLAPNYTEGAPIDRQVARLKELESVREFFAGPLIGIALDAPFVLVFLAATAWIAGPIATVPLVLLAAIALAFLGLFPGLHERFGVAARLRTERNAFLVEMLGNLRLIKMNAAAERWAERHRRHSAAVAYALYRVRLRAVLLNTLSQSLMLLAGAATLVIGAWQVIQNEMTVGALVAAIALVWRVLTPIQLAVQTMARFEQMRASLRSIVQLLQLKPETRDAAATAFTRRVIEGRIALARVTLRYQNRGEPVIFGASLEIAPGEMVAVTGPSGAGKSSLLKILTAMAQPQVGIVTIDGLDMRQIDPRELRIGIAYLPQRNHFFHGTIAQNLRLAEPAASTEDLERAADAFGLLPQIRALPEGFETYLKDNHTSAHSAGFRQRLALARLALKDCPILLLDEPAQALDEAGDKALVQWLGRMKGVRTVLMVTHRPSHIRLCDRIVVMKNGSIALDGAVSEASLRMLDGLK